MPAASIAATVSSWSPGRLSGTESDQALIAEPRRGSGTRGTLPRDECTDRSVGRIVASQDPFGSRAPLGKGLPDIYRIDAVAGHFGTAPVTLKILLENVLRHAGGGVVSGEDVATLTAWRPGGAAEAEIPFMPARVVLQDFTGVPAIVDLAVMRDAMADFGGDPARVNP